MKTVRLKLHLFSGRLNRSRLSGGELAGVFTACSVNLSVKSSAPRTSVFRQKFNPNAAFSDHFSVRESVSRDPIQTRTDGEAVSGAKIRRQCREMKALSQRGVRVLTSHRRPSPLTLCAACDQSGLQLLMHLSLRRPIGLDYFSGGKADPFIPQGSCILYYQTLKR